MKIPMRQTAVAVLALLVVGLVALFVYFLQTGAQFRAERKYKIGLIVFQNVQLPNAEGFKAKMAELGYEEGRNVEYLFKNANSKADLAKEYDAELAASRPDLVVVASTVAAKDLRQRNLPFPVVFMDIGSLEGIVQNLARPEANVTGISGGIVEFTGKRLEVLKEMAPSIRKVIVSPDPKFPSYALFMKYLREAAKSLGVEVAEIPSADETDFVARRAEILSGKNGDAFIYFTGPNNTPSRLEDRRLVVEQLIREKLPAINHNLEDGANIGILASYGNYRFEVGKEAAVIVDKILKGTKVRDIPVVAFKSLALELNLKTAEAVGVKIPDAVLLRANKVYK